MKATREEVIARFWAKVEKADDDGCWLWTGAKDYDGYGIFNAGALGLPTGYRATKFALYLESGVVLPKGTIVRHECDTPGCVRPKHLLVGTQAQNIADKVARNRQARGASHGSAKLTEAQVLEMRARYGAGEPVAKLAVAYQIHLRTAYRVVTGERWTHLREKEG